jgi:hypothetical protein
MTKMMMMMLDHDDVVLREMIYAQDTAFDEMCFAKHFMKQGGSFRLFRCFSEGHRG